MPESGDDFFADSSFTDGGQWVDQNDVGSTLENIFAISGQDAWPARPWLWADVTRTTGNDGSASVGLRVSQAGVDAGAVNTLTFETGHMTHAVFVTTMTAANQRLTTFDQASQSVRFQVPEGQKLVGICIYSSWMSVSDRFAAHIKYYGNGVEAGTSMAETVKRATHSRLFEIDLTKTPSYYLNTVCDQQYKNRVRAAVVEDLRNLAYDVLVYSNPEDACLPPATRTVDGDPGCAAWHNKLLPGVKAWTVPRCLADSRGNHRCVLRSIRGNSCPLYEDSAGRLYETYANGRDRVTNPSFSYRCDPTRGLRCVQTKAEGWFSFAKAECR